MRSTPSSTAGLVARSALPACEGFHELGHVPRTAPGPENARYCRFIEPGPRVALARARRPGAHPADQMATCEVHAARSNEIKPLNLVDQWSRGCGKGLDCFLCLIGHIRGYPPPGLPVEFGACRRDARRAIDWRIRK